MKKHQAVIDFIETNHRNPSKHRIEEHDMLNWLKANRKVMNAGKMKEVSREAEYPLSLMCVDINPYLYRISSELVRLL